MANMLRDWVGFFLQDYSCQARILRERAMNPDSRVLKTREPLNYSQKRDFFLEKTGERQ